MTFLVVALIGLATFAFGGVYPWAYGPLFAMAALIGVIGVWRGLPPIMQAIALSLGLLCAACATQLLPLPLTTLDDLSPWTIRLAGVYNLGATGERLPISVDPLLTRTAVLTCVALSLYLLGLPALLNAASIRTFPRVLAIVAVPLALFAIYTREHNNNLIYGFWLPQDGNGSNQAGPFINRNHFGGWMLMSICVMVGWLFGQLERAIPDSARRTRRRGWFASNEVGAMLLMATAVTLTSISLFWVMSRSSIIGLAMAAVVFGWLALNRRRLGKTRRYLVLATLGSVLLVAAWWRGPDVLYFWFLDERSLLSRLDAWRDGWEVVRRFPLFGTGLNTYSVAMLFYQQRNPGFHLAQAHNDYLQLLAEGGLLVVVPVVIAVLMTARAIRRTLRASRHESRGYWIRAGAATALIAVALQETVEFSLQIPANTFLFCTLAAVALTPVGMNPGAPRSRDTIEFAKDA